MLARFATYRVAHPDGALADSVRAFLITLTPSVGHTAYLALHAALPETIQWATIRHPRARRNEAVLLATLFTVDERARVRAAAAGPLERALLELFWLLRRVETTRLRWADVDLTAGTLRVIRKGGKVTWTLLREESKVTLGEWFVAAGQPPDTAYIFPGRFGGAMNPGSVSHLVRRVLKRAGAYRWWRGAHAWRRTLASEYLRVNPGDLEGLAKLLGHEAISTTFLYNWIQPAELRPRLDRVKL